MLDNYTRVDWLEIRGWKGAGSSGVRIGAHNTSFHGLLVHDPDATATDTDGFSTDSGGDWLATVRNSIVYNVRRAGFQIQNPAGSRQPAFKLDNVTVYNCGGATTTPSLAGGVSLCEGPTSRARAQVRGLLSVGNVDADADGDADFNLGGFADGCYLGNTGTATVAPGGTSVSFGKIKMVRRITHATTDTEAINKALDVVIANEKIHKALAAVKGKGKIEDIFGRVSV